MSSAFRFVPGGGSYFFQLFSYLRARGGFSFHPPGPLFLSITAGAPGVAALCLVRPPLVIEGKHGRPD